MPISPAYCRPLAYEAFAAQLPSLAGLSGLFRAAWAVALHEHPEADVASGEAAVVRMAETVRDRAPSGNEDALLAHLHDVLFDLVRLRGDVADYYNPANSYLPEVLRRRRGIPITLTLLYKATAEQLGFTVYGVNSPGHFLAEVTYDDDRRGSMYVDPFYGGGVLNVDEVFQRIAQATGRRVEPSQNLLARATSQQWLFRMLNNLQAAFAATGRERDVLAMQELQQLLVEMSRP